MVLLNAQEPQLTTPATILALHVNTERRVGAHIEFDSSGRLLILYREKGRLKPAGNWHLIRLTNFLSGNPQREEITFAIPQEPTDPDGSPWDYFHADFFLTNDGSRLYSNFRGQTATPKSGNPAGATPDNIDEFFFQSVVSFDLVRFRLLASADISGSEEPFGQPSVTDGQGNFIVLRHVKAGLQTTVFDASLHVVRRVLIPYPKDYRTIDCSPRPDLKVECALDNVGGVLVLDSESIHRIMASSCHPPNRPELHGFGLEEAISVTQNGLSSRLCIRDEEGRTGRLSSELVPRCSWRVERISSDRHSLLTACLEDGGIFRPGRVLALAQIVDADTLAIRTTISLAKFAEMAYTIFHSSDVTTVAVLENGTTLKLYTLPDSRKQHSPVAR